MTLLEAGLWYLLDRALGPLEPAVEPMPTCRLDSVTHTFQTSDVLRLVPDPVSKTVPKPPAEWPLYDPEAPPGVWAHSGMPECPKHGDGSQGNVHARPYKSGEPFRCCQCMPRVRQNAESARIDGGRQAWADVVRQREKAVEYLGWAD